MGGLFRQEQEKTCAASEIENLPRLGMVQVQFLNPWKINRQPMLNVGVLCVTSTRADVASLDLVEPVAVDLYHHRRHLGALFKLHQPTLGDESGVSFEFVGHCLG